MVRATSCLSCALDKTSLTASTNETDCFLEETITYNLFATETSDGLLTFSKQAGRLEELEAAGNMTSPESLTFISSSNMLVSSFRSNEVRGPHANKTSDCSAWRQLK